MLLEIENLPCKEDATTQSNGSHKVRRRPGPEYRLRLAEPILLFISDTAKDPTGLNRDQELWVLATIPRKGPPRPIALGIKKAGEQDIRPLALD
jgi:hypothetical protein